MSPSQLSRPGYAIGLILYHPECSLLERVNRMINLGFHLYVFDNSPFGDSDRSTFQDNPHINYSTAGKNVGIGYSLSTLCATAYSHGYPRLLYLDQDTAISDQTLEFVYTFSELLESEIHGQYAALVFSGLPSNVHPVEEVRLAISSGSLFNLAALEKIGWHNEKYFVDCVDYEFCVRARRYGYKIGLVGNTPDFDHRTEQPDQLITLIGRPIYVRRYPASRILDAVGGYAKLIFGGLFKNTPSDTLTLLKSAVVYIFFQLVSRLIAKTK